MRKGTWLRVGAVVLCILILFVGCKKNHDTPASSQESDRDKNYRKVKVLEVKGDVTLTREQKEMKAYAELIIIGGDQITTGEEGMIDFRLDEDKYARVGENSTVEFELEGDTKKGAIRIHLSQGSIYNEIENPLSADDAYEIHTPDAVMAVRGTTFEVERLEGENGTETHVRTESGEVLVQVKNSAGEEVSVGAGEEVIIDGGNKDAGAGENSEPSIRKEEPGIVPPETNPPATDPPASDQSPTTTEPPKPEVIRCPGCKVVVSKKTAHAAACGTSNHYTCDGGNHGLCSDCSKRMCNTSVHKQYACGEHYPCEPQYYESHDKMSCGHYTCYGIHEGIELIHEYCKDCNKWVCQTGGTHPLTWADCGCIYCQSAPTEGHEQCPICYGCISKGTHGDGVCNAN